MIAEAFKQLLPNWFKAFAWMVEVQTVVRRGLSKLGVGRGYEASNRQRLKSGRRNNRDSP